MIKAGLLGLGTIGKIHLDAYNRLKGENGITRLEACFDITEENMSEIEDVRKYTNLDEFFENEKGKLDYIDICLPTFMHREIAIKAMEHGFNVLCEKPMALSSKDAYKMCKASEKTGKKLMVAHVLRFSYHFNIINDYIKNETLGRIKNVKYTNYIGGLPKGHNGWFHDTKLSGGPILDFHAHDVDLLTCYFGKPEILSTVGTPDAFSTNLVYKEGFHANFQCDFTVSNCKHNGGRSLRLNFENGYMIKDNFTFVAVDSEGNEINLAAEKAIVDSYSDDMYYNEIKYFSECIKENKPVSLCPPEESAFAIEYVEAEINSSKHSGKQIKFN